MTIRRAGRFTTTEGVLIGGLAGAALLFLPGLIPFDNYTLDRFYRWWVVHLWVEGFFEVFATVVIAFLFSRLKLVRMRTAAQASILSATIFLSGGIIGTLLDEVMAWACSSYDAWAVTAEMTVRFRSPAMPGEELVAEGRVVERRRRIYQVEGSVHGADGRVVAEGSGRYLGAAPAQKAELKDRYGMTPGVGAE